MKIVYENENEEGKGELNPWLTGTNTRLFYLAELLPSLGLFLRLIIPEEFVLD